MSLSKRTGGLLRIMGDYKKVIWKKRSLKKEPVRDKKNRSLLDGIPEDLPSLSRADKITSRVSSAGFDWPDLTGILKKMDEERKELREALSSGDPKKMREEIGDLLFVVVNLARFLKIDPEDALRGTIEKFIARFQYIEARLQEKGKNLLQSNLTEMDALWRKAKKKEKS